MLWEIILFLHVTKRKIFQASDFCRKANLERFVNPRYSKNDGLIIEFER